MFERPKGGERAVLLLVGIGHKVMAEDRQEFESLALSAGAEITGVLDCVRQSPSPRYLIGSGKLDELKVLVESSDADLVLVVGAPTSSNSNRLVEVANKRGARSFLIQDADEIDPAWLEGVRCVGVTAGASSPEFLVQQVVDRLGQLAGDFEIGSQGEVDEGVTFKMPAELRVD